MGRRRRTFERTDAFEDLARSAMPALQRCTWFVCAVLIAAPYVAIWMRGPAVAMAVLGGIALAALVRARRLEESRGLVLVSILFATALPLTVLPIEPFSLVDPTWILPATVVLLLEGVAFVWAVYHPHPRWMVAVLVLAASAIVLGVIGFKPEQLFRGDRPPSRNVFADVALGIGLLAACRVGVVARWWVAALAAGAGLGLMGTRMPFNRLDDIEYYGCIATVAMFALMGALIARIVRATELNDRTRIVEPTDAATARLVVRFQTRPWRTSVGLLPPAIVFFLGLLWAGVALDGGSPASFSRSLRAFFIGAFVAAAITLWCALPALVVHLSHGVTWALERTAGVVVLLLGLTAAGLVVLAEVITRPAVLLGVVGAVAGPVLWAWLTYWIVSRGAMRTGFWVLLLVIAGFPLVGFLAVGQDQPYAIFPAMALVPLAVHQFTLGSRPRVQFLLLIALGVLASSVAHRNNDLLFGSLLGGALTLLPVVAAARRVRTMTAVPLHHPIYTDFDGPQDA